MQVFIINEADKHPPLPKLRNSLINLHNKDEITSIIVRVDSLTDIKTAKTVVEFILRQDNIRLVTVISSNNKLKGWSLESRFDWERVISLSDNTYKSSRDEWGIEKSDYVMYVKDNEIEIKGDD